MKKLLNSYYEKYCFFNFMSCMLSFDTIMFFVLGLCTKNAFCFYSTIFSFLLCYIFDIYRKKYFNLTYQFKKNAKKVR